MSNADIPPLDDAACQRALAILVDVGTSIAQELKTPSKDITPAARATAYKQVAEAVRRTVLLSQHIAQSPTKPRDPEAKRAADRKHVIRAVEETIDAKAKPADAGALRVELLERVDSLDFDADLAHRPRNELIAELCRDLGLANIPGLLRYPRRTPEDIAILCAQAAAPPGSGLPQWLAAAAPQAERNDRAPSPRDPLPQIPVSERRHL